MFRPTTAMVVVILAAAACTSGPSKPGATLSCPTMPFVARVTSGDLERPALTGPAVHAVSRAVFVRPLDLDHHTLVVRPPHDGDRAAYPGDTAMCRVLTSRFSDQGIVGAQSRDTITAGFGRVTLAPDLPVEPSLTHPSGYVGPAAPRYADRPAWVFVLRWSPTSYCGKNPPLPPSRNAAPTTHFYTVFVLDAQTGGDGIRYDEGSRPEPCGGRGYAGPRLHLLDSAS